MIGCVCPPGEEDNRCLCPPGRKRKPDYVPRLCVPPGGKLMIVPITQEDRERQEMFELSPGRGKAANRKIPLSTTQRRRMYVPPVERGNV